jgi:ribonuclease HI
MKNVSVIIKKPLILNKVVYDFSDTFPIFFPNVNAKWIKIESNRKSNKTAGTSPSE